MLFVHLLKTCLRDVDTLNVYIGAVVHCVSIMLFGSMLHEDFGRASLFFERGGQKKRKLCPWLVGPYSYSLEDTSRNPRRDFVTRKRFPVSLTYQDPPPSVCSWLFHP